MQYATGTSGVHPNGDDRLMGDRRRAERVVGLSSTSPILPPVASFASIHTDTPDRATALNTPDPSHLLVKSTSLSLRYVLPTHVPAQPGQVSSSTPAPPAPP